MRVLCPTCRGKGTINDPKATGPIMYCDKDGNACPQVICQTCGGGGWTGERTEPTQIKRN